MTEEIRWHEDTHRHVTGVGQEALEGGEQRHCSRSRGEGEAALMGEGPGESGPPGLLEKALERQQGGRAGNTEGGHRVCLPSPQMAVHFVHS